jgi:hypothetical protein
MSSSSSDIGSKKDDSHVVLSTTSVTQEDDTRVVHTHWTPIFNPSRGRASARVADQRTRSGSVLDALDEIEREFAAQVPKGTNFEIWLAQQIGCSHSDLIEVVASSEFFALRRRIVEGDDIGFQLSDIATRIVARGGSKLQGLPGNGPRG